MLGVAAAPSQPHHQEGKYRHICNFYVVQSSILSSKISPSPPKGPSTHEQSLPGPPAPSPRQPPGCLLCLQICLFWTSHLDGTTQSVDRGVWLLPPSMFLRFMNIVACVHTSPRGVVGRCHRSQLPASAQAPSRSPACQLMGLESPSPWPLAGQNKQRPGKGC